MGGILKKSLLLSFCVGLIACGGSDSDDAATGNGVYAYIDAEATGDGSTTVSALMLDGSKGAGQAIDIASGDLTATAKHAAGGVTAEIMTAVISKYTQKKYAANPIADDDPDTVFDIAYTAAGRAAPNSSVSLPMGFSIVDTGTVSPYEFSFSADTDFVLTWTNDDPAYAGGASFTIYYQISCDNGVKSLPLSLSLSFFDEIVTYSTPMDTLLGFVPTVDPLADTCSVDVELERALSGSLDPNYTGGSITGRQTRSQTFTIVP